MRAEFEHLGSCVLGDLAAAQAGALLEIDRAYGRRARTQGLAGNKVGEDCSRKSFGRWRRQASRRAAGGFISGSSGLRRAARWGGNWKSTERSSWRRRKRPE